MPLEKQVTSRELSQKLKELGVKQESEFHWRVTYTNHEATLPGGPYLLDKSYLPYDTKIVTAVSAFTVAELGEMLGPTSEKNVIKAYGHVFNVPDTRFISATGLQDCMSRPDVGAKMLIYLIENKLITI